MAPEISVIICTHNRASSLLCTLEALRCCEQPAADSWEIIVVDNAGTDHTAVVANHFSAELPLVYAFEDRPGKYNALNHALKIARADKLLFLDDDILPHRSLLSAYLAGFDAFPEINLFGGPVELILPERHDPDLVALPQARNILAQTDFGPFVRELSYPHSPIGGNMAARRSGLGDELHFEPVSERCFHQGLALEDLVFFRRTMQKGQRAIYLPQARAGHVVRHDQLKLRYFTSRYALALIGQEELDEINVQQQLWRVPRYHIGRFVRRLLQFAPGIFRSRPQRLSAYLDVSAAWQIIRYHRAFPRSKAPAV